MTHFASAFDLVAACRVEVGRNTAITINRRRVTCGNCIRALHRAAEIAQYRTDGALCMSILARHAVRRGNAWL